MNFNEYQKLAKRTLLIQDTKSDKDLILARLVLGLTGESGEVAEKVKKYLRGDYIDSTHYSPEGFPLDLTQIISKELGDILWYVSAVASEMGLDLDAIAQLNIAKLALRQEKNKLRGNGDNR